MWFFFILALCLNFTLSLATLCGTLILAVVYYLYAYNAEWLAGTCRIICRYE